MAEENVTKYGPRFKDISGQRFGMLIVVSFAGADKKRGPLWLCRCDCGIDKYIRYRNLAQGTRSCGCNNIKLFIERATSHELSHSPEYQVWHKAKQRCFNPNTKAFKSYGGRGITMCPEWTESFARFYADMGPRPAGYTLERTDVNGDYESGNCIWASTKAQSRNKRSNTFVTHDGETLCIADWAERLGVSYRTLAERYHKGQSIFVARTGKPSLVVVEHDGQSLTLKEWSRITGIPFPTIRSRYRSGSDLFAPLQTKYSSRKGYK